MADFVDALIRMVGAAETLAPATPMKLYVPTPLWCRILDTLPNWAWTGTVDGEIKIHGVEIRCHFRDPARRYELEDCG